MQKNRQILITEFLDSYKQNHMIFWKALGKALDRSDDISQGLYAVLKCLGRSECQSQHQIAKQLRQSDAAVSRKIAQLQERGFITVDPVKGNRRKVQVALTSKGQLALKEVHNKIIELMNDLLQEVSDNDLQSITASNLKIQSIVKKVVEGK